MIPIPENEILFTYRVEINGNSLKKTEKKITSNKNEKPQEEIKKSKSKRQKRN